MHLNLIFLLILFANCNDLGRKKTKNKNKEKNEIEKIKGKEKKKVKEKSQNTISDVRIEEKPSLFNIYKELSSDKGGKSSKNKKQKTTLQVKLFIIYIR